VNKGVKKEREKFIIPSYCIGIGGWAKPIFPYLDSLYSQHFGTKPDQIRFSLFDFDEASATIASNGLTFSIDPYFTILPKKVLKDNVTKMEKSGRDGNPIKEKFKGYIDYASLRYFDTPGLNLNPQLGNIGWRFVWESHVLKDLQTKVKHLHVTPRDRDKLERRGIKASNRSLIWVVCGIASTTGPTGLIPFLCEISHRKPPEANVFALLITPLAYRDKSSQHREKGRAICWATMETLCRVAEKRDFNQPYGISGYRIVQADRPFDLCFVVDGTFSSGRSTLEADELARLIALYIFRITTTPLGEALLRIVGNINTKEEAK